MTSKKEALNSGSNNSIAEAANMSKKYVRCWHCQLNGYDILDEFKCCKRCGTNLEKYPLREKHQYPDLDDKKIAKEVLGTRRGFIVPEEPYDVERIDPSKLPIKWNPLQIVVHWVDKTGEERQRRVDPVCFKCRKIATHLLVRTRKNGAKLYLCDTCYDENPEWEADESEKRSTRNEVYKKWMKEKEKGSEYP